MPCQPADRAQRTWRNAFAAGIVLAVMAVGTALVLAAQGQPAPSGGRRFQTRVDVVTITATVTDREGHLLSGLPREAFEVYEDGELQTLTQFTNARVPIGVGALVDISDSMFGKRIADARAAVDQFLLGLLTPDDEFFILAFNHRPHVLTGWTREAAVVHQALDGLKPSGGTAAYDAIVEALPLAAQRQQERTALILISDGADTASNATLRDLRTLLLRSEVFVYAIAIDSPDRQPINTRVNVGALREITSESGGRTEVVQNSTDIATVTAGIAEELNHQYSPRLHVSARDRRSVPQHPRETGWLGRPRADAQRVRGRSASVTGHYVAFLRAINVGGHRIITMSDLRATFERAGGRNVTTLIQSGNVLFDASARGVTGIVRKVGQALGRTLGTEPEILVRSVGRIETLIAAAPFRGVQSTHGVKLYVAFLLRKPRVTPALPLVSSREALEVIRIDDREAFVVSRQKPNGLFGFPNTFIEDELGVAATTRNWSTITKIVSHPRTHATT